MSLELIGIIGRIIGTLGAILVARTALRVHHRVWREHKIDSEVFSEMHREQKVGMFGLGAMIVGLLADVIISLVLFI